MIRGGSYMHTICTQIWYYCGHECIMYMWVIYIHCKLHVCICHRGGRDGHELVVILSPNGFPAVVQTLKCHSSTRGPISIWVVTPGYVNLGHILVGILAHMVVRCGVVD